MELGIVFDGTIKVVSFVVDNTAIVVSVSGVWILFYSRVIILNCFRGNFLIDGLGVRCFFSIADCAGFAD